MQESPGDRDLRDTLPGTPRPTVYEPRPSAPSPPPQPVAPAPPQQDFTYVVDERGLAGLRIVAKIIDCAAVWAALDIILIPVNYTVLLPRIREMQETLENAEPDEFPTEILGTMFLVLGLTWGFFIVGAFLYHFFLERMFQQTLGKKAFELRLIDVDGGRVSPGRLWLRAALRTLAFVTPYWILDVIVLLGRQDDRCLTDLICNTRVIRRRKVYSYPGSWR